MTLDEHAAIILRSVWDPSHEAPFERDDPGLGQLRVIQELSTAISNATTAEEIYQDALNALWQTIAPSRAAILLFDSDGVIRVKAWRGLSEEYRRATEGHSPWAPETPEPEPVLVEDHRTQPSLTSLRDALEREGIRSLAFIPLVSHDRLVGKFTLYHDRPHRFTEREVWMAKVIAGHITFALEQRRVEDELRVQKTLLELQITESKREEEEQRFLAQASDALASSLEYEASLADVARMAVSSIADWCVVYIRHDDGSFRQLAVAQNDPSKEDVLRTLQATSSQEIPGPIAQVLASREPLLLPEIPDDLLWGVAPTERDFRDLQALGWRSAIAVPLVARDTTLGAVVLTSASSGRRYEERDLAFAQELARRISTAVDNAQLHRAERHARRFAQEAADRSTRLQRVTAALAGALTASEVGQVVVHQAVSAFSADAGAVYLLDQEEGAFKLLASIGYPADLTDDWRTFPTDMPGPARDAILSGEIVAVQSGDELVARWPELREMQARTGDEATVAAPITVRGKPVGIFYLVFRDPRPFTDDDREFFTTLSHQCSQALDRAQLYESEHQAAETLQLSLLPERLPEIEGVTLRARYLPAGVGAQVGGDWYDLIPLDGKVGLAVGDVEGRGLTAASTMGQFRTALRAYAVEGQGPGKSLELLNRYVHDLGQDQFATIAYLVFDPATGHFSVSNAGHPPPLVVSRDGGARFMEHAMAAPVGAAPDIIYRETSGSLGPDETLILYTDGLVDRRDVRLPDAMERLRKAAEQPSQTLDELLDGILGALTVDERSDDVALLGLRRSPSLLPLRLRFPTDPQALKQVRSELRTWLADVVEDEAAIQAVLVACGEACTNAIEHPLSPTRPEMEIDGDLVGGEVIISVRDFGSWQPMPEREERGWGLRLMQAFMDEVEVKPGSPGTEITMRRRVGTARGRSGR